ncbi:hypothetical protein [Dechloromonas sp. ZS-1]|uniref:hypothetical protein n=1 Tax=Dechloromonas sp. ZS-1 TaxID=3138067 RepID=UPI0031FE12EB
MITRSIPIDDAVAFAKRFLSGPVLSEDIKASTAQEHENVVKALQLAAINPDTNDFDTLVMLAADGLSRNERLPDWLAVFAADVLLGKRKRPTKRGQDEYGNWVRDYKLWQATQEVSKAFNLQHYTNNELSAQITAAEIVCRAAGCSVDVVITAYKKFTRIKGRNNPQNSTPR